MKQLVLALLLSALPVAAQTSSLQGAITDAQGAAVPDAIVTAKNLSTSAERKTLASAVGARHGRGLTSAGEAHNDRRPHHAAAC